MSQHNATMIHPSINNEWEGKANDYDELLVKDTDHYKRRIRRRLMSEGRKVFVVSQGTHNFSEAEKFGELIFLSTEIQLRLSASAVYRRFSDILARESRPKDLLLVTGLAFLNAIATNIFDHLHGNTNFLIYHKPHNGYIELSGQPPDYLIKMNHEMVASELVRA